MSDFLNRVSIREAEERDLAVLRVFEQGVIAAERPFDPTLKPDPLQYYNLEGLMASPTAHLVVAEYEGQPIASGYARIDPTEHYVQHRQLAYVGFLFTLPEFRGKGVNGLVIEALKNWAKSHQLTEMQLEVYFDNQPALKAYEKAGFKGHLLAMRLTI